VRRTRAKKPFGFEEHRVKRPRLKGKREEKLRALTRVPVPQKKAQSSRTGRKASASKREKEEPI
jgi:hypothetical protein